MTTTLRPTGPALALAYGGHTRPYAICVNSRPVGRIRITVLRGPGGTRGEISQLEVTEGLRRGRGTVAVLAAEEVLRGEGCARVEAGLPDGADAARALADSLGYRPVSRWMSKPVPAEADLPDLGAGRTARPVTAGEFPDWREARIDGFARLQSGGGPAAPDLQQALTAARATVDLVLDRGPDSEGSILRVLRADHGAGGGADVATLWLGFRDRGSGEAGTPGGGRYGWIYDVEVYEGHRGRGHGRAAMLLAERECRAAGIDEIALNVHEGNTPARRLYESLGYRTTRQWVAKRLL